MGLVALATIRFCRSLARLSTRLYTRFFSAAEALRMNSENDVEKAGLGLEKRHMSGTSGLG